MKLLFFISFLMFVMTGRLNAQNDLDVIKNNWLQYSDAPNAFYHFLSNEAYTFCDAREDKISKIATRDDVLKRQAEVSQTMWKIIGPFPVKTPLNAKITGLVRKKGYRIENLIYESLPGFYVTAPCLFRKMSLNRRLQYFSAAATAVAFTGRHSTSCLC